MNKLWLIGLCTTLLAIVGIASAASEQGETITRSAYKVLDNRFRLDHGIDEVTMVLYRTPGSGPAVVVRPDGSKLYAHSTPSNVHWFGEGDFDVITIDNPMPGPWQIIGSLDKRNNIEILSDLQLSMDKAPDTIYQNERLKLTAQLNNHGNRLNIDAFYKSTELSLYLLKRQVGKSGGESGVDRNKVGRFFDNGTGLDEFPRDGIFTGEIDFTIDPGRYQLYMTVSNKTFTRVASQDVVLKENPIKSKVIRVKESAKQLHYSINPVEIDLKTVALNLVVKGTADFYHSLSITSPEQAQLDIELDFIERTGDYKVSGWLFATTNEGREVAIAVHPERFSVIKSMPKPTSDAVPEFPQERASELQPEQTGSPQLVTGQRTSVEPEPTVEEGSGVLMVVLLIVLIILLLLGGAGGAWLLIQRKKSANYGQDSNNTNMEAEIDLNSPEER